MPTHSTSPNKKGQGVNNKPHKHGRVRRWFTKRIFDRRVNGGGATDSTSTVATGIGGSSGDHGGITDWRQHGIKTITIAAYNAAKKTDIINALCGFKDFVGATQAGGEGWRYSAEFREYYSVKVLEQGDVTDRAVLITYHRHAIATDTAIIPPGRFYPEAATKPYHITELLAKGSQGVVYAVSKKGKEFVVKLANKAVLVRSTMNEFILMRTLSHPNIVQALGPLKGGFVMEYADTTLSSMLAHTVLDSATMRRVMAGIVMGLKYLHSRGVAHLDIKPDNVLLDTRGNPKLTDFGLSMRFLTSTGNSLKLRQFMGTLPYMAPELMRFGRGEIHRGMAMPPLDMWACGCIAYEIVTAEELFGDVDASKPDTAQIVEEKQARMVAQGLELPATIAATIQNDSIRSLLLTLAQKLLRALPSERPSAADVAETYFSQDR